MKTNVIFLFAFWIVFVLGCWSGWKDDGVRTTNVLGMFISCYWIRKEFGR